ncbi:STY4534 family ICE replication protein [uncultured Halomonas sp.]|uniref:STY4534 family ICE replication protein n=1 Tax=uncultured Halomonas sp. TaxID=173971 RepID=UPI002615CADC|nr:STY4534 family ICE replication protein [uncultured Halomonas sp.]
MSDSKFFDLHINGIGYLRRAREVSVRRGDAFLAVDINAMHGAADDVQFTRFDCRVNGAEAQALIRQYMEQINDRGRQAADGTALRTQVLVGFRLGDLYPDLFTYERGEKKGETGVSLKARLLKIHWIKINGEMVYKAEKVDDTKSHDERPESSTSQQHPSPAMAVAERDCNDDLEDLLPEEVRLSKDDPDFFRKKEALKARGYRFDGNDKVWRLKAA